MRYLAALILTIFLVNPAVARADDDAQGPGLLARMLAVLAADAGSDVSGDANTITNTSYEIEDDGRVVNTGDIVININIGDIELSREGSEAAPFAWNHQHGFFPQPGPGTFNHWGRGFDRTGADDEARERIHAAMQDVDPEFMRLMFRVGRLAKTNPEFREHLEALLAEFAD